MAIKENTQGPRDCITCNVLDVGTVIDNKELSIHLNEEYASHEAAQIALKQYTVKANKANPKCIITSNISNKPPYNLIMDIEFECQAEVLIFQLSMR